MALFIFSSLKIHEFGVLIQMNISVRCLFILNLISYRYCQHFLLDVRFVKCWRCSGSSLMLSFCALPWASAVSCLCSCLCCLCPLKVINNSSILLYLSPTSVPAFGFTCYISTATVGAKCSCSTSAGEFMIMWIIMCEYCCTVFYGDVFKVAHFIYVFTSKNHVNTFNENQKCEIVRVSCWTIPVTCILFIYSSLLPLHIITQVAYWRPSTIHHFLYY